MLLLFCDGANVFFTGNGRVCAELWRKWYCGVYFGVNGQEHDRRKSQYDCISSCPDSTKGTHSNLIVDNYLTSWLPWWLSIRVCLFIQETQAWSLGWEDHLDKEMASHSSILAWKTPWTENTGGLQSIGSQSIRHSLATEFSLATAINESVKLYKMSNYGQFLQER